MWQRVSGPPRSPWVRCCQRQSNLPELLKINASVCKAKMINKMASQLRGAGNSAGHRCRHGAWVPSPLEPLWPRASCPPRPLPNAESLCFGVPLPGPASSGPCGRQRWAAQTRGAWWPLSAAGRTVLRGGGRPGRRLAPSLATGGVRSR